MKIGHVMALRGPYFDTQKLTDAGHRRDSAKGLLEKNDNAGCIRESQAAVELAVKALLEVLDIEYPPEHDMSREIPKAIHKLQQGHLFDAYWVRNDLGYTTIASKVLSSVKDYSVYGLQDVGIPAGSMFMELGEFAKVCFHLADATVTRLSKLILGVLNR